ncbi:MULTISPECIES: SGNH/GDSL hydrolase family protein [unclassified Nocardia]|uniref:SGNH/GDSL hydrolase family protein n=1 Tax=unclassified Nocardia TaxID=2637762 RepID=UPI001CE4503F|nr:MULTISPECIES: SGNH/GDSL hydrolase family protein [unclassified Nocardia]
MKLLFRSTAVCGTVFAFVITSVTCMSVAGAAPTGSGGVPVIVLGDSYASNSMEIQAQGADRCSHGADSWPSQLSRSINRGLLDLSCSGAVIDSGQNWNLAYEAGQAADAGAFGPDTEAVLLQFGLNDSWGNSLDAIDTVMFCVVRGCERDAVAPYRLPDPNQITAEHYADRIAQVVKYIRYYAPRARIMLIGYPELLDPAGTAACIDLFGVPVAQPRATALIDLLNSLRNAQAGAADLLGIDFLDTAALTHGHGLCTPDPWVNGIGDPRADVFGIPGHPSARGDAVTAAAIKRQLNL